MQKHVNLVDLVKSFPTSIYLQKSASIQPRTSFSKFGGKFNSLFIRLLRLDHLLRDSSPEALSQLIDVSPGFAAARLPSFFANCTLLHIAAIVGRADWLDVLVEHGVDVGAVKRAVFMSLGPWGVG